MSELFQETSCKSPFKQIFGRALRPIPQEKKLFVGWAGEPVPAIFARGLLYKIRL